MSCPSQESLEEFVDGALADARPVRAHLADCAGCSDKVARLRSLARLLPAEALPSPDFDRAFFAKLAAERPSRWRVLWEPLLVTACATAVAVFAVTRPTMLSTQDAFVAQNQDLLQHLDLAMQLDTMPRDAEDFAVIAALPNLRKAER
jgi:anti-sigma factor RsiW